MENCAKLNAFRIDRLSEYNRAHCYSTKRCCAMHFSLILYVRIRGCSVKSFKAKPVAINTHHNVAVLNFFVGRNGFWFKVNQLQP